MTLSGPGSDDLRLRRLQTGDEAFLTFPSPILGVESIGIACQGTLGTDCNADITVLGY